jgi:hypothetical protein
MKKPFSVSDKIEAAKVSSDLDDLRAFARDEFVYVRAGVAINPAAPEDALRSLVPDRLSKDDDFQVAAVLLLRAALPAAVAHRLCTAIHDARPSIQPRDHYPRDCWCALVAHPDIAFADLSELLDPQTCPRHLRGWAATSSKRADVLALLAKDGSTSVAEKAQRRLAGG